MRKKTVEQFIWLLDLLEAEALQEFELAERAARENEQPITPDLQLARLEARIEADPMPGTALAQCTEPALLAQDNGLPLIREILSQPFQADRLPLLAHIQDLGQEIGKMRLTVSCGGL
jgi:hypothetical protein